MAGALFSRTATMQDDETNLFLNVGHEYIIYIYIYMYIYISNFRRNSWVESNPTSAYTRIILTIQTSTSSINQSIVLLPANSDRDSNSGSVNSLLTKGGP